MIHRMTLVNETWLQIGGKLNGKRKHMLACRQNAILKGSCKKYGMEDFHFLFFDVRVLTTLLLEFDLFYSLNFNQKLFWWIALVKLAKSLSIDKLTRYKIDALDSKWQLAVLIKLGLTLTHIYFSVRKYYLLTLSFNIFKKDYFYNILSF